MYIKDLKKKIFYYLSSTILIVITIIRQIAYMHKYIGTLHE